MISKTAYQKNKSTLFNTKENALKWIIDNYGSDLASLAIFKAEVHSQKREDLIELIELIENPISSKKKYQISIIGDAKASTNRFGLTDTNGNPIYYGNFLEKSVYDKNDSARHQHIAEVRAFVYAIRLIRDYCYYKKIKFNDIKFVYYTDSQVLVNTFTKGDETIKSFMIKNILKEIPIQCQIRWIRGVDNPADEYTLPEHDCKHINYKEIDKILIKIK